MAAFIKTIIFCIVAALLAVAGLLIPAHIRSVDNTTVQYAGAQGPSNFEKVEEALNAAYIGPAMRIAKATQAKAPASTALSTRTEALLTNNPAYQVSGGPAPIFEDFLELVQGKNTGAPANPSTISLLLPRSERAVLSSLLAQSNNTNVAALLEIRNLQTLSRLHPADHAAGAPYDAGVLTLGLLIEGGHFTPPLAQKIGKLALQADLGIASSVQAIEDVVIATLSLGRQLEYRSLISLAQITDTLEAWSQMATLFRAEPTRIDTLYTLLVYHAQTDALFNYMAEFGQKDPTALEAALYEGPAAVRYLIDSAKPIYEPSPVAAQFEALFSKLRPGPFIQLATEQRGSALALKAGILFIAGIFFSIAMGTAWRGSFRTRIPVSRENPVVIARNVLISLVVVVTAWAFFEPQLLQSNTPEKIGGPRIEFAVASSLESLKSPVKSMQEINQVTLLVLALFFIIQLVIYCFCLIKLREIAKQKLSSTMKLNLLENEENLFDFGLYVGLGGTVLSLILVAVGVVEASLMAAYASTLFGILFTAMLKVVNLRGYRRRLILEAGHGNKTEDNLMSSIKL